ncbi:MAG: asparagine synthase (glutamine-hydrolyzing) [Candidatus Babeliales bacterium]|jgi:asparagine synthase (glutamine-hydrolysing)
MCGFAGFYNLGRNNGWVDQTLLERMQQRLVHRGPDAGATWISAEQGLGLAARRLKIIDLSDAGNQPFYHPGHNIVLCYNGEIYNYRSLRSQLELRGYQFASTSDTEVIVNAYHAWGIACLDRFEGMFALALFDMAHKKGYLVRDRMGVKPLYFSLCNGMLSFASEIKALWELPWLERKINNLAWYHYLTFMVAPSPWTIFEGVYKLPAGFYLEIDEQRRVSFHEWYNPIKLLSASEKKECASESYCIQRIKQMLLDSVAKRMVADVPVAAYLSGGLDSSLIVALMSRVSSKISTFTVACADSDYDERSWARRVAALYGTDHHEIVVTEQDAFGYYEQMVQALDEPLADCVCIPFYYVSRLAHEHGLKVAQVGEGADELFFGYSTYMRYAHLMQRWYRVLPLVPRIVRGGVARSLNHLMPGRPLRAEFAHNWQLGRMPFWSGALAFGEQQKREVQKIIARQCAHDTVVEQIYPGMQQGFDSYDIVDYHHLRLMQMDPEADIGKQMLYLELKQRLPELLLMRADKMSMATSVEAREPFLDHFLVEFMLNVPWDMRCRKGQTKYLLKKVAEEFLPQEIVYRPKVGFAAPTYRWIERGNYFRTYFQQLAHTSMMQERSWCGAITANDNKNVMHRAVQNWTLQQMWSFMQTMAK